MLKKTRFRFALLISTSVIGCISLTHLGHRTEGTSPHTFLAGKLPGDTSPSVIALELKRGFEAEGRVVQVLPITSPLTDAIVREQGKKDGATKKKIHERALLLSSVFIEGYSCFDILTQDKEARPKTPTRRGWLADYSFRYANAKRPENTLAKTPLDRFERQRLAFQKLVEVYIPLPEGAGTSERKILCGQHINFSRPFKVTVLSKVDGKTASHSLTWASDDDQQIAHGN